MAEPDQNVTRKRASVMFVDILGFSEIADTRGTEAAYAAVSGCLRELDAVARRHRGAVDKYLGDSLMVLFGGLDAAQGAERDACAAALEMRDVAHAYRDQLPGGECIDVQIGINTGFVTIGEVGASVVREFAVMGDAVNVAARLESKAGRGGIYTGAETQEAAGEIFEFEAIAPLVLKGKSRPVPAFALVGRRVDSAEALAPPSIGGSPWVGRVSETQRLVAWFGASSPAPLWLFGETGLGKTRLALEALRARDTPATSIAYGVPHGTAAWSSLAALVESESAVAGGVRAAVAAAVARGRRWWVFDDVDRADPASRELAISLAYSSDDAHWLLISRNPPPEDWRGDVLELGPLGADDAAALLGAVDVEECLDPAARDLVLARAAGNPATLERGPSLAEALVADAARAAESEDRSDEAQRRRATLLFADLSGFTAMSEREDPKVAYDIVTDCLTRLGSVATRWGGTVEKHLGDCVLALFGVPRAIEDAPRAAINAAIEMLDVTERFNRERGLDPPLSIHVGIETGLGISADISGPLIREFALMGDSVALANELTDAAGSWEILIGAEAERAAREHFETRERSPVERARGGAPARAFEVTTREVQRYRRRAVGRRISSELVGRDAELEVASVALASLARGEGDVLEVVGEAGLGKSRLLEEFRETAPRDTRWLWARSLSNGSGLRFHPFADLLLQWLELSPDDEESATESALERELEALMGPEEAEILAPSFRRMLGLSTADVGSGEAMSQVVLSHTTRWLRGLAAERPTTVVFEDLHWADLSSIDLLESLLRLSRECPLLFVLLYRPGYGETSGRVGDHVRASLPQSPRIRLEPLDRDGSRELVRNLFRGAAVPHALRSDLVERAAGNPFFLEEAIRSLLDEGALVQRGDRLDVTERIHDAEIPATVQEVVLSRIDRLERSRREFLQVASIMGVNFYLRVVEEVLGKDDSSALSEELVSAELLRHADALPGLELAFQHPLIQEVAYDTLLEERRRELHTEVARAIEGTFSPLLPGYHAMLAFHFGRGVDPNEAEPHLFAAGEEAARSAASNEALQFFREASEVYLARHGERGDPEKRATLEGHLAVALLNRGQLGESVDHFDAALELRGVPVARSLPRQIWRALGDLPVVMSRLYVWGALRGSEQADDAERASFEMMFRRAVAQSTSDPNRFVVDSLSMLRRLGTLDPRSVPDAAALYAGAISIFSYGAGLFGVGERILRIADELAERGAIDERELYYRLLRFLHYFWSGDWSEEHRIPNELLNRGLAEGRLWEVSTYLDIDTDRRLRCGEFAAAEARLGELAEVADNYQHDLAWSAVRAHRTFLPLERRELDVAARAVESYYEEHADVPLNLYALGERAKIEILQRRWEDAQRTLERCSELRRSGGRIAAFHGITHARSALLYDVVRAEEASEAGDRVAATRGLERAQRSARLAISTSRGIASRRPEVYRLVGRLAWLRGKRGLASKWWQRSLGVALSMGARPELARLLAEVAVRTGESDFRVFADRSTVACADEARSLFEEMSLRSDLERLANGVVP